MSNQKSLSESVKLDLIGQVSRLRSELQTSSSHGDPNPSSEARKQLDELMSSLKSSELEEFIEQERAYLRELFTQWRLQSLKRYDVCQVHQFTRGRERKMLKLCMRGWFDFMETTQRAQVLCYQMRVKSQERLKKHILQRWGEVIRAWQEKHVKLYDARHFWTTWRKRSSLRKWRKFLQRAQNTLVQKEFLEITQRNKLISKFWSKIKRRYLQTESFVACRKQIVQQRLLSNILFQWFQIGQENKDLNNKVNYFRNQLNRKQKRSIFTYIKVRSDENKILRRVKKLGHLIRQKILMEAAFRKLRKNKDLMQCSRYLGEMRNQQLLRLSLSVFAEVATQFARFKAVAAQLEKIRLQKIFTELQKFCHLSKYRKFMLQYAEYFRTTQLKRNLLSMWKLYHRYLQRKAFMNAKTQSLHVIKISKLVLRKWHLHIQRVGEENSKFDQIKYSREYKIKRAVFQIMKRRRSHC